MKYWVYINDKVVGPYEEDKLATLEGFNPDTLLCKDGTQNWVKASSVFDFDNAPAASAQPAAQTVDSMPDTQATATAATVATAAASATSLNDSTIQQLLAKIDHLTQEIDGMKTKLDQTWQASAATQAAMEKMQAAPAALQTSAPTITTSTVDQTPIVEDASITNTQNLVDHAEEIVAQAASTDTAEKPLDFLNEIHIGETPVDGGNDKGGEEVVLRSALDSMYNTPMQTEEEKENTFQDLLSPGKIATAAGVAAVGAAAITAATMNNQPTEEQKTENQTPTTDTQREEIINEITAPTPKENNAVLQAIDQAQAAPVADVPTLENASLPQEPEKQSLDLSQEEPALNLASITQANAPLPAAAPASESVAEQPEPTPENLQTAQELVVDKKEETLEDGLLSQQDLDDAFTERAPISSDFPLPEDNQPASQANDPVTSADMTEVQLKEGSTYLISDFIPPATTGNTIAASEAALAATAAATSDTSATAANTPAEKAEAKQDPADVTHTLDQMVEEILPNKAPDDMTMSKVILENTIRTKRGASMDIKTVPMVKEPADSNRLNLTDSDLDLNAQHDLKEADFKQPSSGATKMILGALVSIICLVGIYVMLAYLDIVPAQYNFIKKPAATNNMSNEQMNEMLGEPAETVTVSADNAAAPTAVPTPAQTATEPVPAEQTQQPAAEDPMNNILGDVKNFALSNGQTLEQLINTRHPAAQSLIEWSITTAVEPDNYSILVKVPPENPQSFRITYRFNYNTVTKALDPTISDSKNLLDSIKA